MENINFEKPDLTYLKELMDGDKEIVLEVLTIFKTEIPKDMANLKLRLDNKEWESLGKVAHKLKSSVGNLGLNSLRDEFLFIEQSGKNNENIDKMPDTVNSVILKMNQAFIDIDEEIKKLS